MCLILLTLWAAAYLPGLASRDLRLEEGRRATPAREMLASGDYLVPRLYGDVYLSKPPGYFWLVAGIGKIQGHVDALTTRIPSAVAVLLGAFAMLGFARRELSFDTRAAAALMLLSTASLLDKGAIGEIDSLLSLLVFAALAVWYEGYARAQEDPAARGAMFWSWIGTGALMALAVLLKGPGGPLEFVPPVLAFLLWEKQLRRLVSPAAVLAIVLAAVPTLAWVRLLEVHGNFDLLKIWSNQVGVDAVAHAARTGRDDEGVQLLARYLWQFPLVLLGMLLPWVIWTLIGLIPREARRSHIPPRLWRFLACCVVMMILPFYLWTAAHGRHVMAVAYPACLLAAAYIVGDRERMRTVRSPWLRWGLLTGALLISAVPMACGVAAVGLARELYRPALATGWLLLAGGVLASAILAVMVRQTTLRHPGSAGVVFAVVLAVAILWGRALAGAVVLPWVGQGDASRIAGRQLERLIPSGSPVFTTRTFWQARGDAYYNIQFYAGPRVRALHTWDQLPHGTRVTLIASPEEIPAMQAAGVRIVQEHGEAKAPQGPPPLAVLEVER